MPNPESVRHKARPSPQKKSSLHLPTSGEQRTSCWSGSASAEARTAPLDHPQPAVVAREVDATVAPEDERVPRAAAATRADGAQEAVAHDAADV